LVQTASTVRNLPMTTKYASRALAPWLRLSPHRLRTRPTPSLNGTCTTSTRSSDISALLNARTASADESVTEPGAYTRPCTASTRPRIKCTLTAGPH
jgi:hypothetical protein